MNLPIVTIINIRAHCFRCCYCWSILLLKFLAIYRFALVFLTHRHRRRCRFHLQQYSFGCFKGFSLSRWSSWSPVIYRQYRLKYYSLSPQRSCLFLTALKHNPGITVVFYLNKEARCHCLRFISSFLSPGFHWIFLEFSFERRFLFGYCPHSPKSRKADPTPTPFQRPHCSCLSRTTEAGPDLSCTLSKLRAGPGSWG